MSEPRVLLVVEQLRRRVPGGIGTYARGLLQGLASPGEPPGPPPGEAVRLVLSASRARGPKPDPLRRHGWPVRASVLGDRLLTRAWGRGLVRAPRGFDVVHAVSLAAPQIHEQDDRAALAVTVHDVAWRQHPEATTPRGRAWHEAALQRAIRTSRAMVVPSEAVAADVVAAGYPSDRVSVVAGGADHLPAPDDDGASALLAQLGVDRPYLLSVGTLEPRKNLPRLLEAYAAVRSELPEPWPLVVVGQHGWGRQPLPAPAGVVLAGAVPEPVLAGLYAGARAFAYVPLTEGYGLPPLEAMTFGVPVVVSSTVPSVRIRPGEEPLRPAGARPGSGPEPAPARAAAPPAIVVDPFDVDGIAAGLLEAVGPRGAPVAAAGAALASRRTWASAAGAHVSLWEALSS